MADENRLEIIFVEGGGEVGLVAGEFLLDFCELDGRLLVHLLKLLVDYIVTTIILLRGY